MEFLYQGREKAKTICFSDGMNLDVIRAAHYLNKKKLAEPLLLGSPVQIREFASAHGLYTSGLKVRNPLHNPRLYGQAKTIFEKNKEDEINLFDIQEKIKTSLWYGMALLEQGLADTLITGSIVQQTEVIRAANIVLGNMEPGRALSTFYLLYSEANRHTLVFADCNINARPGSQQLAEIALDAAKNFSKITKEEARVAMLSFSTAGSAEHEMPQKVRQAVSIS